MKSNTNMLEALKKLLQKPSCNPATMAAIDKGLDKDDDSDEYSLQKSDSDLKEEEIEKMLQWSEEERVDIKNISETLETIMPVKGKDIPSLAEESFSKRLKNVGNKIIEVKDECEKTFEDCKASLYTQWNTTKERMAVERKNQQSTSQKQQEDKYSVESEDSSSSEVRRGFFQLSYQLRKKEEDRLVQLDQDCAEIAQDLDNGKKFGAMYKIIKAVAR